MMSPYTPACNDNNHVLNFVDGRMDAAQAKWSRLTPDDLSGIHDKHALIATIAERYGLPHWVAMQDVERWLKATFAPRP
jgi:hypothetical protein